MSKPFLQSLPPAFSLIVVDVGEHATADPAENTRRERTRALRGPVNVTIAGSPRDRAWRTGRAILARPARTC